MKIRLPVAVVACVVSSQALAIIDTTTDTVRFSGSVQRDNGATTSFDIAVPAGKTSKLILPDGSALEFSAAANHDSPSQSVVRLLDPSGKQLHSETAPGNAPASKSVSYSICNGQVRFVSPAPAEPIACRHS